VIGLYQKAIGLLNKEIESRASAFNFDETSGISKEDQKDILEQIEKITSESKISVTPEIFTIKPEKKGVLLPVLINLLAAVLLGSFITFQYFSFQQTAEILTTEADISGVDQGKLLEQIQKEQEEELARKEQEISGIQNELLGINAEREDLIANMDLRVQEKEEELRMQLERELEAERSRLLNQGVSEDEIQRRLFELEQQKETESNAEVASFIDEMEKQRALYEDLEDELQGQLASASQDKENLEQEYERRAQELEEAKSEAEEELLLLSEQQKQEEIVSAQLIGFYNILKEDMNANRLEEALEGLGAIRNFMNDRIVLALPEISKRRDVEFFVVGNLEKLIEIEIQKESADTTSLVASANLIISIREKVVSADNQYNSGNLEQASVLYQEALSILPEIDRSHSFFINRVEQVNQERLNMLERYLNNAQNSYEEDDFDSAKYYYIEALRYVPISETRISIMISQIEKMGFQNEVTGLSESQTEEARELLEEADTYYSERLYNEAVAVYVSLIAQFPYSSQVNESINGIAGSLEGLKVQSITSIGEESSKIAEMEVLLNEKISDIEILQLEKAAIEQKLEPLKQELTRLRLELEEFKNNPAVLIPDNNTDTTDTQTEAPVITADLERLLAIEKEYNQLKALYIVYITKEDSVLSEQGDDGLVQSKIYLDIFLASRNIENIFAGLRDRIKMYDIAFERVGREVAFLDIKDLIYDLSLFDAKQEKLSFLDSEIRKNTGNEAFVELLEELKDFVEES